MFALQLRIHPLRHALIFPIRSSLLNAGTKASFKSPSSDDEQEEARKWVSSFQRASISEKDYDVTYSRASGPGGQNVNKLVTFRNAFIVALFLTRREGSIQRQHCGLLWTA